jgi:hypothetical protein
MKLFIVSVLAGVCVFTSAIGEALDSQTGSTPSHQEQADKPWNVTIPFQLVNKTIFLQVVVGSRPLWFVLDTGDKYAIVDLSIAKSLGLELGDQVTVGGGGKQAVMGNFVKNSSFHVDGLEGFSQPLFLAVPLDELANLHGHEFAGVLGFDFLKNFVVEIDYLTHILTLYDASAYQYRGDGESLPITFNAAAHPEVRAQIIDDKGSAVDGTFVVDIGSAATLIMNTPFVEKQGFLQSGRPTVHWLEGASGGGVGGSIEGSVGRIKGFKLGPFRIDNPVTVFSQASSGAFASADAQGNVGAGILEKFKVILDYSRKKIIFEPNSQFNKPLEYNRSGFFLTSSGQNYKIFTIKAIADNSTASEAGLRAGDILTIINGHPSADYTLSQLRSMFQDAKECDLTVERGHEHLRVRLTLRAVI